MSTPTGQDMWTQAMGRIVKLERQLTAEKAAAYTIAQQRDNWELVCHRVQKERDELAVALSDARSLVRQLDYVDYELREAVTRLVDKALAAHKPCPTCDGTREIRERQPYPDESTIIVRLCPNCMGGKKE